MSNPLTNLFGNQPGNPFPSSLGHNPQRPHGNWTRFLFLLAMIVAAVISRLIPHPPNFAPIAAMALFAGAHFRNRLVALAVPLAAMALSDLFIGFNVPAMTAFVYFAFALTVVLGMMIRRRRSPLVIGGASLAAGVLFFLISNFGVWLVWDMYPRTPAGLVACYAAAIPFFRNAVAANLFYSLVLFGGFALAQQFSVGLREQTVLAR